jgi:hypothetical protein
MAQDEARTSNSEVIFSQSTKAYNPASPIRLCYLGNPELLFQPSQYVMLSEKKVPEIPNNEFRPGAPTGLGLPELASCMCAQCNYMQRLTSKI